MSIPLNPEAMLPAGFVAFTHEGVLLAYDPLTGQGMKWNTHNGRGGAANMWAVITPGTLKDKYTRVRVGAIVQQWHRIVGKHFLAADTLMADDILVGHIEDADGSARQDRLSNLRMLVRSEVDSHKRRSKSSNRSSRFIGVCWGRSAKKWLVSITIAGKKYNIGRFLDETEAATAYIAFCIKHDIPHTPAAALLAAA